MVVVYILPQAEFGRTDHREDHFKSWEIQELIQISFWNFNFLVMSQADFWKTYPDQFLKQVKSAWTNFPEIRLVQYQKIGILKKGWMNFPQIGLSHQISDVAKMSEKMSG